MYLCRDVRINDTIMKKKHNDNHYIKPYSRDEVLTITTFLLLFLRLRYHYSPPLIELSHISGSMNHKHDL